jgi:hypothetical protein
MLEIRFMPNFSISLISSLFHQYPRIVFHSLLISFFKKISLIVSESSLGKKRPKVDKIIYTIIEKEEIQAREYLNKSLIHP